MAKTNVNYQEGHHRKVPDKCAVDGVVGTVGKLTGICGSISVNGKSECRAHGNKKCKHRIKRGEK